MEICIDLETYSSADLAKCGVYRYVEATDFDILLFGYSVDGGAVNVIDLACGELLPEEILDVISDDAVTKWAFNAQFERICISAWLRKNYPGRFFGCGGSESTVGNYLNPSSWKCLRVWSAYLGLPLSLEAAGKVLGMEKQKLTEGKDLINYFCRPCSPTKSHGGRMRNLPGDAPGKWEQFKIYNQRDVEVEMSIQQKFSRFPVPDFLWEEYRLDQEINDRGVAVDLDLVKAAIRMDDQSKEELTRTMKALTNLENPNSVSQLKQWLAAHGLKTDSLNKKEVSRLIQTAPPEAAAVLQLRQQLAKSSVKKYTTMAAAACSDGRARGMFQFYGASRSGRWAGRLIQLQNLPRNSLPDLAEARALVKSGDYEAVEMLYEDVPDTLSQLIRTAFIPRSGCKFIVADFSSIEARVLSWLAGEEWRMKAFADGKDIYCMSASRMFGVSVEKHGINAELRQKGKVAELACGYGGSVGALKSMGALDMGLTEAELPDLVSSWREANPRIVQFWQNVEYAAIDAVRLHEAKETAGLTFSYESGILFIRLPSGRRLAYVKPRVDTNQFGNECITYEGVGKEKKWKRLDTFGGKLVENIVQGISRDILANAMKTISYCFIIMHIHDELVLECSEAVSVKAICEQMGKAPPWASGLNIRADGYETMFYRKE